MDRLAPLLTKLGVPRTAGVPHIEKVPA